MEYTWEYHKLGDFTYNILPQSQIKPFLREFIMKEWENDLAELPGQTATTEWLAVLPEMEFTLEVLELADIQLRRDVMELETDTYNFLDELRLRVDERKASFLRGVSTEPLLVNGNGMELMDGYTRYFVLHDFRQEKVYAYGGRT